MTAQMLEFESREAQINADIRSGVDRIRSASPIALPAPEADLVRSYVQKIQGTYNVDRAKADTDNAIDLLYIAYNTTPQTEGDVRNNISALMNKVITAQQDSERTMRGAMRVANNIVTSLDDAFAEWVDAKESGSEAEIRRFVSTDLVGVATEIKTKALKIRDELLAIAGAYDDIIRDNVAATAVSEKALSAQLRQKAAVEKEMNEANARREQLESLVTDLKEQVAKFDKMARDYEARASTAEQRAFVMSIVKVGAQMISQAVPAIAMAAGGPAPMLATSALSALSGPAPAKTEPTSSGAGGGGGDTKASEQLQIQNKVSEQKAEIRKVEDKAAALKADITTLTAERDKIAPPATDGASPAQPAATAGQTAQIAEYEKRIKAKTDELKAQETERARLQEAVTSLQSSLGALEKGAAKLSDEQQQQAASLRDMQMRMLDKVEAYENERRNQSAELVKVNALLKGKRQEDDSIELAIRSLNLSLSGLKRMKEIVEEIAFFFKSFADFMDEVAMEASDQLDRIEAVADVEVIRKNRLAQLVRSVDDFFIKQTAEWRAAGVVADRFSRSFADGWSKLNKLSGEYITGDRLSAYLEGASIKLTAIVAERDAAADQKIASLNAYRARMQETA